jgi:ABC-2 type transport system ATP-binding protein/lipopolysaccharide transport system ATP-binding protein
MALIDLKGVGLDFPIYDSRARSFKQAITDLGGRLSRKNGDGRITIEALRDITLSVRPGERLGVIGRNGAGKSTLLKVMAGVYEPPIGRAEISGRVASLLDMTMGMDAEATGYENIVIRGVFLGMTFAQARSKIPEIEEFTELGSFLSLPLRTYSSGMMVRLAFAIATAGDADILLADEVIGAGDASFAQKAQARFKSVVERSKILVIATHDESVIASVCTRAIVLSGGKVAFDGSAQDAIEFYQVSIR